MNTTPAEINVRLCKEPEFRNNAYPYFWEILDKDRMVWVRIDTPMPSPGEYAESILKDYVHQRILQSREIIEQRILRI